MNTYRPSTCGTVRHFGKTAELFIKDGAECLKINDIVMCNDIQSGKNLPGDHKSTYATRLKEYDECEKRENKWNNYVEKNIKK
jgi:hypothetical protein